MWVINHKHTENKYYLTLEKKKYTIGRSGSDIVLRGDSSISRYHAALYISPESLCLEDVGSKYGTYHNEQIDSKIKMPKHVKVTLQQGDRILFGALKNEWVVSKSNIITVISSLNESQLNEINSILESIGMSVTTSWTSKCTHLTMSEITITIKLLHALIEQVPIVSCEFWKEYSKNIRENKTPPEEGLYLPKKNASLSSAIDIDHFKHNNKRKTLFCGKTFVFMSRKHYETFSPIVCKAGGQCKNLNSNIPRKYLLQKDVVVVQYIGSTQTQNSQSVNVISEYLADNKLRMIPEYEIGLAVVCCSVEKYCNPSFSTNVFRSTEHKSQNVGTILAEHTHSSQNELVMPNLPSIEIADSDQLQIKSNNLLQSEVYESNLGNSQQMHADASNNIKRKRKEENESALQTIKKPYIVCEKEHEMIAIEEQSDKSANKHLKPLDISTGNYNERDNRTVENDVEEVAKISSQQALENNQLNSRFEFLRKKTTRQSQILVKPREEKERPIKRGRIARLTDDNIDNEDDIFNFGIPSKKTKSSQSLPKDSLPNDAFGKENRNVTMSISTNTENRPAKPLQQIKVSPLKITTDGWLSKHVLKIKDEDEGDTINQHSSTESKFTNSDKGFTVHLRKFSFPSKEVSYYTPRSCSSLKLYNSKKNFKTFVKKQNYKPQTVFIRTVPAAS